MGISKAQEKEYAKILYVNERLTNKEIAERVGITEKTIAKWIDTENWLKLRTSLLSTRQANLIRWHNQLEAINVEIEERPDVLDSKGNLKPNPNKKNIPTSTEADTMSKISSNIQRLETETGLGEYIEVGRKVLTFIQAINLNDAKLLKNYFDEFINNKLKNG